MRIGYFSCLNVNYGSEKRHFNHRQQLVEQLRTARISFISAFYHVNQLGTESIKKERFMSQKMLQWKSFWRKIDVFLSKKKVFSVITAHRGTWFTMSFVLGFLFQKVGDFFLGSIFRILKEIPLSGKIVIYICELNWYSFQVILHLYHSTRDQIPQCCDHNTSSHRFFHHFLSPLRIFSFFLFLFRWMFSGKSKIGHLSIYRSQHCMS